MKKKSKQNQQHFKKKQPDAPLTRFGELLKMAVKSPSTAGEVPVKKAEDTRSTNAKPQHSHVASASKPKLQQNHTGASAATPSVDPKNEKKNGLNTNSGNEPEKRKEIRPTESYDRPILAQTVGSMPIQTNNPPSRQAVKTSGHETNARRLMRDSFWKKLEGDAPSGHVGRPLRITLGIDLGTSYSKVVYRIGTQSYPVLFGENRNNFHDYLVPSIISIGSETIKCRFEVTSEKELSKRASIPNFKICLTCERGDSKSCSISKCEMSSFRENYLPQDVAGEQALFLNSFYLAKLIAKAKTSVRMQLPEQDIPSDMTIKWSANMAVPDCFISTAVAEGFKEALEIGWLLSEIFLSSPNVKTSKTSVVNWYIDAKRLREEIRQELMAKDQDFDCFAYSEVGAEVASVTNSPTSEEGLYVLVDVGAGTVDTSVFRFRRVNGESKQETYAADVIKLGASQIDARAKRSFGRKSLDFFKNLKEGLFGNHSEAMLHITSELQNAEEVVTTDLEKKLTEVFRRAFRKENIVDSWKGLRLVMSGGGSAIESYQKTAREAFSICTAQNTLDSITNSDKPVVISHLNAPADFDMGMIPQNQFHRFSVAYGLSFPLIELPEITPESETTPLGVLRHKTYVDPTDDG